MAEWDPELILNQWKDTISTLHKNIRPMAWREIEQLRTDIKQSKGLVEMQLEGEDPDHRKGILDEFESLENSLEDYIASSISIHGQPKKPGLGRFIGLFTTLLKPLKKRLP